MCNVKHLIESVGDEEDRGPLCRDLTNRVEDSPNFGVGEA
jgi:hypothetical protein